MSCYCIFDFLTVSDAAKWEDYKKRVRPVVEKFGGRYLAAGGKFDVVEGSWRPVLPVILQFPSLQKAHEWYDSADYRELKAQRLAATQSNAVFLEGF